MGGGEKVAPGASSGVGFRGKEKGHPCEGCHGDSAGGRTVRQATAVAKVARSASAGTTWCLM